MNREGLARKRMEAVDVPGLTDAGKRWLTNYLDPFHDTDIKVDGLPDSDSSKTVVQVINKTIQVSAPGGTAGNWAAMVFTGPEMFLRDLLPVTKRYGNFQPRVWDGAAYQNDGGIVGDTALVTPLNSSLSGAVPVSTFNVWSWTTDPGVYFPNGLVAFNGPNNVQYSSSTLNMVSPFTSANASSKCRVIALAFEIVNTTQELQKQGLLTACRVAGDLRMSNLSTVIQTGGTNWLSVAGATQVIKQPDHTTTAIHPGPPGTLSEAMAYGAVQWEAKDGCYVIGTGAPREFKLTYGTETGFAMMNTEKCETIDANTNLGGYSAPTWSFNPTNSTFNPFYQNYGHDTNFDLNVVYLTGLSLQTTFEVRCRAIVEVAPHINDTTYSILTYSAQPSPPEDVLALEIAQRVSAVMPPAVPVGLNPDGEWWDSIKKVVKAVAPAALAAIGMIPHPAAQLASKIGGAALVATNAMKAVKSVQEKKQAIAKPAPKSAKK
jgi:hypothetical protein